MHEPPSPPVIDITVDELAKRNLPEMISADLNHDGIYNDAPGVVADANGDATIDAQDLEAIGVASKITTIPFHISGDPK